MDITAIPQEKNTICARHWLVEKLKKVYFSEHDV